MAKLGPKMFDIVSQELMKKDSLIKFETAIKKMETTVASLQTVQNIYPENRMFTDSVKNWKNLNDFNLFSFICRLRI